MDVHRHIPRAGGETHHHQADHHEGHAHLVADATVVIPTPNRAAMAATIRREPKRPTSGPDIGSDTSDPAATASSTNPSEDGSRPS